jgi:hypothetical protein
VNSASDKQDFLFKIVAICLLLRYNDELKGLADKPNLKFVYLTIICYYISQVSQL